MNNPRNKPNPMFDFATSALSQANMSVLPFALSKIESVMANAATKGEFSADLKILAAQIYRALDKPAQACDLIKSIINNPPPGNLPLLASSQRLLVSLYLDEGRYEKAFSLSKEIDGFIIINAAGTGDSASLCSRSETEVSVETRLLEAEAALYTGDYTYAANALADAGDKLSSSEARFGTQKLSATESRKLLERSAELRYLLHFWSSLLRISLGDEEGYELLTALCVKLEKDVSFDRRIYGRVRAALGRFDVQDGLPPSGIGLREARRLYALGIREVFPADAETNSIGLPVFDSAILPDGALAVADPSGVAVIDSDISTKIINSHLQIETKMAQVLENMTDLMKQIPLRGQPTGRSRPFAFGGGFEFLDLPTQIDHGFLTDFTGFLQAQWNPEMVETSILAGNLNPLARAGEGFVFMVDGKIVDVTIGEYDAPVEPVPGSKEAEEQALRNLRILIQIGMGIKLDTLPDGFGSGYPSMGVKGRAQRILVDKPGFNAVFAVLDEELSDI